MVMNYMNPCQIAADGIGKVLKHSPLDISRLTNISVPFSPIINDVDNGPIIETIIYCLAGIFQGPKPVP